MQLIKLLNVSYATKLFQLISSIEFANVCICNCILYNVMFVDTLARVVNYFVSWKRLSKILFVNESVQFRLKNFIEFI